MEALRSFFAVTGGLFMTAIYPMFNPVIILVMLFLFDIAAGIICDRIISSTGFSFKKFLKAIEFLILYSVSIAIMYLICYLQRDIDEGTVLLKTITYACAYFYLMNIFKNLKASYPGNRFFAFLYFALSLEIITERIPELRLFLTREKEHVNDRQYKGHGGIAEAIQLAAGSDEIKEVLEFIGQEVHLESEKEKQAFAAFCSSLVKQGGLSIRVPGGLLACSLGDYVIKDKTGMVYSLKEEVFNKNFKKL